VPDTDPHALDPLLAPRSIALLGASSDGRKFGGRPLAALLRHGFPGALHPVNPRHAELQGVPCVATIEELPDGIDLAVLLLPAAKAVDAARACIERGVGALAVFSGGFAESGAEGAAAQEQLVELSRAAGVPLLGPNCPGYVNAWERTACSASAWVMQEGLHEAPISLVVQSGAIAGIFADRALHRGVGIGAAICTGNEADVDAADVLDWLVVDGRTRAVALFLEGLGGDGRLAGALERTRRAGVGICVLRGGSSEAGRRTIASHTGAIVGDDGAFDAMCASLGIVRARDYAELLEAAQVLAAPRPPGRRLAVSGSSGGMNTLLADAAAEHGLELPELDRATVERLAQLTPDFGSSANPVDLASIVLTEPERIGLALEAMAADDGIDTLVVTIGDHPADLSVRFAEIIGSASARYDKPTFVQWSSGPLSDPGIAAAGRLGLVVLTEPARCGWALAAAGRALSGQLREPLDGSGQAPARPSATASESELKQLLDGLGIRTPARRMLPEAHGAGDAVAELGGRGVVKADRVGLVHKTEAGAVRVGVRASEADAVAAEVLDNARAAFGPELVRGLLIEEQVSFAVEVMIAAHVDPEVGPIVTVSAGGVLVELLRDSASRMAPVTAAEATAMLGSLRSSAVLDGWRGAPAVDRTAIADVVVRVSELAVAWSDSLMLLELNPVAATGDGVWALDVVAQFSEAGG
jgi:acetate---CoA ligase (ADP-forming)